MKDFLEEGLLELVLKEWWTMDKSSYECSCTDKGDHKSKGSGVKLSREAVPLIRRRGCVVPDVGGKVGCTAWKEDREAGVQTILHPERLWGPSQCLNTIVHPDPGMVPQTQQTINEYLPSALTWSQEM